MIIGAQGRLKVILPNPEANAGHANALGPEKRPAMAFPISPQNQAVVVILGHTSPSHGVLPLCPTLP